MQNEVQHVDDSAGAPIAIVERMDALELVMDERHLDQGIGIEQRIVIDEALKIVHEGGDLVGILGRSVNGAAGGVLERGAGHLAETSLIFLKLGLDLEQVVQGKQACLLHGFEAAPQCLPIAEDFLRGGIQ